MAFENLKHPLVWAIRHKPSGNCIPEPCSVGTTGYTNVEPTRMGIPRLFLSEDSAKRALTQWLRGIHYQETDTEENEWSGASYTVVIGVNATPVSTRIKEDMEVIPVYLFTEANNG